MVPQAGEASIARMDKIRNSKELSARGFRGSPWISCVFFLVKLGESWTGLLQPVDPADPVDPVDPVVPQGVELGYISPFSPCIWESGLGGTLLNIRLHIEVNISSTARKLYSPMFTYSLDAWDVCSQGHQTDHCSRHGLLANDGKMMARWWWWWWWLSSNPISLVF